MLLPLGVTGMSDAMKTALKLVTFEQVDISKCVFPAKKTKEEKTREFTVNVIKLTKIAMQPVKVSYLSSSADDNSSTDEPSNADSVVLHKWIEGTVIKLSETKWQVVLSDGTIGATDKKDLLNSTKFYVKKALNRVLMAEECKAAQKVKRRCQIEHKAQEAVMLETAKEE